MRNYNLRTYIGLTGAPACGKGTQGPPLSEKTGLPVVASGDEFRKHIRENTELGRLAKSYNDRGILVPDGVTIDMMMARLMACDAISGAVLDGFPRTLPQAVAIAEKLKQEFRSGISLVLYIHVPEEILLARLTDRWICGAPAQHVYSLRAKPPKVPGVCDFDGAKLEQRVDDIEAAEKRLQVFKNETLPVVQYYRERDLLVQINGHQEIARVTADIDAALSLFARA